MGKNRVNTINELSAQITKADGYARSNLFAVEFPSLPTIRGDFISLLTKDVALPTRQINTLTREVSLKTTEVAYGYTSPEISMRFRVLNDAAVRKYFEEWQRIIIPGIGDANHWKAMVNYYDGYTFDLKIHQLRKELNVPIYEKDINLGLPTVIENRLNALGPINFGNDFINLGITTKGVRFDVSLTSNTVYTCQLYKAYPTAIQYENLTDDVTDGLSEITVTFAYQNWIGTTGADDNVFSKAINTVENFIFDLKDGAEKTITKTVKNLFNKI